MEGPHEYAALGASGVARAGVLRARLPASLSTGVDSRADERVAPALVSAVYRHRRNTGGGGTDAPGSHAHSALARLRFSRWIADRDDLCHCCSPCAW